MIKEKKRPSFLSKKTHFSVPWRRICSLSISSSCNPKQRTKKLKTLEKKKKKTEKEQTAIQKWTQKNFGKKDSFFFFLLQEQTSWDQETICLSFCFGTCSWWTLFPLLQLVFLFMLCIVFLCSPPFLSPFSHAKVSPFILFFWLREPYIKRGKNQKNKRKKRNKLFHHLLFPPLYRYTIVASRNEQNP